MYDFCLKDDGSMSEFSTISGFFGQMARDEARHGKAFEGLLKRYFG